MERAGAHWLFDIIGAPARAVGSCEVGVRGGPTIVRPDGHPARRPQEVCITRPDLLAFASDARVDPFRAWSRSGLTTNFHAGSIAPEWENSDSKPRATEKLKCALK
jgi:hypothetical protein